MCPPGTQALRQNQNRFFPLTHNTEVFFMKCLRKNHCFLDPTVPQDHHLVEKYT